MCFSPCRSLITASLLMVAISASSHPDVASRLLTTTMNGDGDTEFFPRSKTDILDDTRAFVARDSWDTQETLKRFDPKTEDPKIPNPASEMIVGPEYLVDLCQWALLNGKRIAAVDVYYPETLHGATSIKITPKIDAQAYVDVKAETRFQAQLSKAQAKKLPLFRTQAQKEGWWINYRSSTGSHIQLCHQ